MKLHRIIVDIILILVSCVFTGFSLMIGAAPTGGTVQYGSATINYGTNTIINQATQKGIINWQSFGVGQGESVNFVQPNASAITLNRVMGGDVSSILGVLTATGHVLLINPSGIVFGPNARVDVAGLIASTADITDADFLNGNYLFTQGSNNIASIINQGIIRARDNGMIALVAPNVQNSGIIKANLGTVILGSAPSGSAFTIDFYGDGLLQFVLPPVATAGISNAIVQSGQINANGGKVLLTANTASAIVSNTINMSGVIEANSVVNRNGQIILMGGNTNAVSVGGKIRARGNNSGEIGGAVQILAQNISILDGAVVDVSGQAGGGTVLIGGGPHGEGLSPVAQTVYVDPGATILANAMTQGNGGTIVAWADQATGFYGTAQAMGGPQGGNGGFVETSGGWLDVGEANISTAAPMGVTGTWLLDPYYDVQIINYDSNGSWVGSSGPTWTWVPSGQISNVNASEINSNLSGNNVIIETTSPTTGTGFGDIYIASPIAQSGSSNTHTLTFTVPSGSDIEFTGASGISGNFNIIFGGPVYFNVNDVSISGANVTFSKQVGSGTTTPYALTVNASGNATFSGDVGNTASAGVWAPLTALSVTASGIIFGSGSGTTYVKTNGTQYYTGNVSMANNTQMSVANANDVVFSGTVNGNYVLTATAGRYVEFLYAVGGATPLAGLNVTATGIYANAISTQGTQTYNGPIVLNNSTSLNASAGNISLNNIVNGAGAYGFSATASAGTVTIGGNVGAVGNSLTGLTVSGSSGIVFNGRSVYTSAAAGQSYSGAVTFGSGTEVLSAPGGSIYFGNSITLGQSSVVTLSSSGNAITLRNIAGSTPGAGSLTLNVVPSGTGLTTNIGDSINTIGSLVVIPAITFGGGNVYTSGNQTYSSAVTLGAATILGSTSGSGNIGFSSTINGANSLTISDTGTGSGYVQFGGAVGGGTALSSLTVTAPSSGTININGGSIRTTSAQTYSGQITLGSASTTLSATGTSGSISLGTVAASSTGESLTVSATGTSGTVTISGAIGSSTGNALSSLTVGVSSTGGAINFNGGSVYTSAAAGQSYVGVVTFGSGTEVLSAAGGSIYFGNTITLGASSVVTLSSSGNSITLPNIYGASSSGTGSLTLNVVPSPLTTTIGSSALPIGSLVVTPAITFSSGSVYTSGAQTYSVVTLSGSSDTLSSLLGTITFTGGNVFFGSNNTAATIIGNSVGSTSTAISNIAVTGDSLILGGGTLTFGSIGSGIPLQSVTLNPGSILNLGSGVLYTTGNQTYTGATLGLSSGTTTLRASGTSSNISLGAVTGNTSDILVVSAAGTSGTIGVSGSVGLSSSPLGSFTETAPGGITFNGGSVYTSGSGTTQTYTGAVTFSGGTTDTLSAIGSSISFGNALTLGSVANVTLIGNTVGSLTTPVVGGGAGYGNLTLGSTANSGAFSFNYIGNSVGNALQAVTLNSGSTLTLGSSGSVYTGGGGGQTYNGTLNLGSGSNTLNTSSGNMLLNAVYGAGDSLNITNSGSSAVTFNGSVGTSGSPLSSMSATAVSGGITFGGSSGGVYTSGSSGQSYSGGTTYGVTFGSGAYTLSASSGTIGFSNSGILFGSTSGSATIIGNTVTGNAITTANNGSGNLTLGGGTLSFSYIGSTAPAYLLGSFTLNSGSTLNLGSGGGIYTENSQIYSGTLGLSSGTTTLYTYWTSGSSISLGAVTGNSSDSLVVSANYPGEQVFFSGSVGTVGSPLGGLTVSAASGITFSNANVYTSGSGTTQTYNNAIDNTVTFVGTDLLSAVGSSINFGAGNITLNTGSSVTLSGNSLSLQNIVGSSPGAGSLTLNVVPSTLTTSIGSSSLPIASLTVNQPINFSNGNVYTSGSNTTQTYNNAVTFAGTDVLSAMGSSINFGAGSITLNSGSNVTFSGSNITLRNIVGTSSSGTGNLTLNVVPSTLTTLIGGSSLPIASLLVTVPININGTSIYTSSVSGGTGAQTYQGAVSLSGASDTLSATGGAIGFSSGITFGSSTTIGNITGSSITGTTVNAASGTGGGVLILGGPAAFTNIGNSGSNNALSSLVANSDLTLLGSSGGVYTSGSGTQTYNGAIILSGGNYTLSSSGYNIVLGNMSGVGSGLTVNTGSSGQVTFNGNVGDIDDELNSLTVTAPGGIFFNNAGIYSGAQIYNSAITLTGGSTTLDSSMGSGNIVFNSTIDGSYDLAINAGGDVTFSGAIGGSSPLNSLNVWAGGGNINLNTGVVNTISDQTLATSSAPIILGESSTTLSSSLGNIYLVNVVGASSGVGYVLNVNAAEGSVTLNDDIGIGSSSGALGSLTVTAPAGITFSNSQPSHIYTSGSQTYTGPAFLRDDTTLNASFGPSGDVIFFGSSSTISGGFYSYALTVKAKRHTVFGGEIGGSTSVFAAPLSSLTILPSSDDTTLNGNVTTLGAQTYGDPVLLGANVTLTTQNSGSGVEFDSTVNSVVSNNYGLTISSSGNATFGDVVGGTTPLGYLSVTAADGINLNGASVYTSGGAGQSYGSAVTFGSGTEVLSDTSGSGISFSSGPITLDTGSSVTLSGSDIALQAISGASSSGTGDLILNVVPSGGLITNIGDPSLPIGSLVVGPAITFGSSTNSGNVYTSGGQSYSSAVTFASGSSDTLSSSLGAISFSTGVTFGSSTTAATITGSTITGTTVNAASGGGGVLTLGGPATFTLIGNSGTGNALSSLTVNASSPLIINGGAGIGGVYTTGAQTYSSAVTLSGASDTLSATSGAIGFGSNALTLGASTSAALTGSSITGGSVNGTNTSTLTLGGPAIFASIGGSGAPLASLLANNALTLGSGGGVYTTIAGSGTGAQTYNGALNLGSGTTTLSAGGGNIALGGVNGSGDTLNIATTGAGTVAFNSSVGSTSGALSSLTVGVGSSGGAITFNGVNVYTREAQTYTGPVILSGNNTTLNTSDSGGSVIFNGTINGGYGLTINDNYSGGFEYVTFGGIIGGVTPLGYLSVTVPSSSYGINLNGGTITTSGAQIYSGTLNLGGNTTLTATGTSSNISLGMVSGAGDSLVIGATDTSGTVTLGGNIGTYSGYLDSVVVSAPGGILVNGGGSTIYTTGPQTYTGPVTLGAIFQPYTTGASGSVMFSSSINGAQTFEINAGGSVTLGGAIGNSTPLSYFSVQAPVVYINGGSVAVNSSSGNQNYYAPVVLGGDTTFSGHAMYFNNSINGAVNLVLSGYIGFSDSIVGSSTALSSLTINGPEIELYGTSVSVTTTGAQQYNSQILGHSNINVTLSSTSGSSNIVFGSGGIHSPYSPNFIINDYNYSIGPTSGTGQVTFGDTVGQINSLAVTAPGGINLNGGGAWTVYTYGSQTYTGPVILGADTVLDSNGVVFNNATSGSGITGSGHSLTINSSPGSVTFNNGLVGGSSNVLGSLTIMASGGTTFNNGSVYTTGSQTYYDALSLIGSSDVISASSGNLVLMNSGPVIIGSTATPNTTATIAAAGINLIGGQVALSGNLGTGNLILSIPATFRSLGTNANPLGSLTVTTPITLYDFMGGGGIYTSGAQTYNGVVSFSQLPTFQTTSGNITFNNNIVCSTLYSCGGTFTVNSAGQVIFNNSIVGSSGNQFAYMNVTGAGGITFNNVNVNTYTVAPQTYNGSVILSGSSDIFSGGTISFSSGATFSSSGTTATFIGSNVGSSTTAINAASGTGGGNLIFGVGGAGTYTFSTLGSGVTSGALGSVTLNSGTLKLGSSGGVYTSGSSGQTYTSGTLGLTNGTTTLSATGGGISLGTVTAAGSSDILGINAGTTVTFSGSVGTSGNALSSLSVTGPSGIAFNGGNVYTSGSAGQSYSGAVSFGLSTEVLSAAGTGGISFTSSPITLNSGSSVTLVGSSVGSLTTAINAASSGVGTLVLGVTSGTGTYIFSNLGNSTSNALSSVTLNSGSTLNLGAGGSVYTSGSQTYTGATLGLSSGTTTLNASGTSSGISLGTVSGAGSSLVIGATGASGTVGFSGSVGGSSSALSSLTVTAPSGITFGGGGSIYVYTSSNQQYNNAVNLGVSTILNSSGGNVGFSSTINGGNALTVKSSGNITFGGVIGGTTPLASLSVLPSSDDITLSGSVTTSGVQIYGDPLVLGAAGIVLTTQNPGSNVEFDSTVNSTVSSYYGLTVNSAGSAIFNGVVGVGSTSTSQLGYLSATAANGINLNGASVYTSGSSGQRYIGAVTFSSGTEILSATGAGGITFVTGPTTLNSGSSVTLYGSSLSLQNIQGASSSGTGSLILNAVSPIALSSYIGLNGSPIDSLTVNSPITFNGGTVYANNQLYSSGVTLGSSSTTLYDMMSGGNITFASSIVGTTSGGNSLSIGIRVGSVGTVTFDGDIGSTAIPLSFLGILTNGGQVTLGSGSGTINVITTGSQAYDNTILASNAYLSSSGGAIRFSNNVNDSSSGAHSLTINATGASGWAEFDSGVGNSAPLASLNITTPNFYSGGAIYTTGDQNYNSSTLNLSLSSQILSASSGNITLDNVVSYSSGAHSLTVNAGGGIATINGSIGNFFSSLSGLTVSGSSGIALNNASVYTSGSVGSTTQTYNNAVTFGSGTEVLVASGSKISFGAGPITLNSGANVFLVGSGVGSSVVAVDAASSGAGALTLGASSTGQYTFSNLGASTLPLGSVTLNSGGTLNLGSGGGVYTTIAGGGTGAQTYSGVLNLGSGTTILSAGGGSVALGGVNGAGDTLSIATTGAGTVAFNSSIGSSVASSALGSLSVTAPGGITFNNGSAYTTSAQTYSGAVNLNGASDVLSAGGAIGFGSNAVTLGTSTAATLIGSSISGSVINGVDTSTLTLTSNSDTFTSIGSSSSPLGSLAVNAVSGAVNFNVGAVYVVGSQVYNNSLVLSGDTIFGSTTGTGNIVFNGNIDTTNSSASLTVDNGTGSVTFGGDIGDTSFASLSVTAPLINIGGITILTSGPQTYTGAVMLTGSSGSNITTMRTSLGTGNVVFSGTSSTIGSSVNGISGLVIGASGGGYATFGGVVGGGSNALNSLGVTASPIYINGGAVTTTGAQTYTGAVYLPSSATTTLTGSSIGGTGATVNGANTSSLVLAGPATFVSVGGSSAQIASLVVNASSPFTLTGGGGVYTTGAQTYSSAVNLNGASDVLSAGGAIGFGSNTVTLGTGTAATLTGSSITGSAVNGANTSTLTLGGPASFASIGGSSTQISSLTVNASSPFTLTGGGGVYTTGAQTYSSAVNLNGASDVLSAGDVISFGSNALTLGTSTAATLIGSSITGSAVNGANTSALTLGGPASFASIGGSSTQIASLTVNASSPFTLTGGGGVYTTGAQTYGSSVTLNGASDVLSAGGAIGFGSNAVTLGTSTAATLAGSSIGGTGATVSGSSTSGLTLTSNSDTFTSIGSSSSPLGSLAVGAASGAISFNVGSVYGINQTYNNALNLGGATALYTESGAGVIQFNNAINGGYGLTINDTGAGSGGYVQFGGVVGGSTPLSSLTVTAPASGGTIKITVSGIATIGAQTYNSGIMLGSSVATTTLSGSSISGTTISGTSSNGLTLTSNSDTFTSIGSSSSPLGSLAVGAVSGAVSFNVGSVYVVGSQAYNDPLLLSTNTVIGTTAGTGNIVFNSSIDTNNGSSLTVNDGSGSVTFGGDIGDAPLASLSVTAQQINIGGITISTTGPQTYTGAVMLTGSSGSNITTMNTSLGTGNIVFSGTSSTVGSSVNGISGLVIGASGGGYATFGGVVGGGSNALSSLGVTASPIYINGGAVTTTGAQTYTGAVNLPSSATTTLTGSSITGSAANGDTTSALTLGGPATFVSIGGSSAQISSLTVNASSPFTLTGGGGVYTTGAQTYSSAVNLNGASDILSAGGAIGFGSNTLTLGTSTAVTLTGSSITGSAINGDTTSALTLGGPASFVSIGGSSTQIASLVVNASSPFTLTGGGGVYTTGAQTYSSAVNLNGASDILSAGDVISFGSNALTLGTSTAATLTGSSITGSAVNGDITSSLTLGGPASFASIGGSSTQISSLTVSASSPFTLTGGGGVYTTGAQTYSSAVNLNGASDVLSAGGAIGFGSNALTLGTSTVATLAGSSISGSVVNGVTTSSLTLTSNSDTFTSIGSSSSPLGSLAVGAVSGAVSFNVGSVYVVGSQAYNDPLLLSTNTVIGTTAGTGNIVFNSSIDTNNGSSLTVNDGSGSVTFGGDIGDAPLASLSVTAQQINIGGITISTTGPQTYTGAVMLTGSSGSNITTMNTSLGTGNIVFSGTSSTVGSSVNGISGLVIGASGGGYATFGGVVGGGSNALSSLGVTASPIYINGGAVITTGAQTYTGPVTLPSSATTTLTGSSITGSTVNGDTTSSLTLGGPASFASIGGSSAPIGSLLANTDLTLGSGGGVYTTIAGSGSGAQTYNGALNLSSGTTTLSAGGGNIALSNVNGAGNTLSIATTGAGTVAFNGLVGSSSGALGSLSIAAPGGITFNNAGIYTASTQTYSNPITLAGGTTTLDSTSGAGGDVVFNSTIDGGYSLVINSGANVTFGGVVGGSNALSSLGVTASQINLNGDAVTTTGDQTYTGPVVLGVDNTLTGNNISFTGTVDSNSSTAQALTISASGAATFGDIVGGNNALTSLGVTASQINLNGGSVTTTGAQTYTGPVVLGADNTLSGGDISFTGTVDSDLTARVLTLSADGIVTFGGAVGGSNALSSFNVTASQINLNGGAVTTTGAQSYDGPVVLGADNTLRGSEITFGNPIDSDSSITPRALTLSATSNSVVFWDVVGGNNALSSLDVTGLQIYLIGGAVTTTGAQTYRSPVVVGADSALSGGAISFAGTVDSYGANALTLSASGAVTFSGAVGGSYALGSLDVTASQINLNGASVYTSGGSGQSYAGAVTFGSGTESLSDTSGSGISFSSGVTTLNSGSNVTFSGSSLTLQNIYGASSSGTGSLTLNVVPSALTTAIGSSSLPIGSLTVTPAITFSNGSVYTSGTQTYNGQVALGTDTSLTTIGGGDIDFLGIVSSATPNNLTLNTSGSGNISFNGQVGSSANPIGALEIVNANNVTVNNVGVYANSFSQDAGNGITNFGSDSLHVLGGWSTTVITNIVNGHVILSAAPLDLGVNYANLFGSIAGSSGIGNIVLLHSIQPGTQYFNGVDISGISPVPPTPPVPPPPVVPPEANVSTVVNNIGSNSSSTSSGNIVNITINSYTSPSLESLSEQAAAADAVLQQSPSVECEESSD